MTVPVTLIHPCVQTTIQASTVIDMQYMCARPTDTQTFLAFTDTVSTDYGVANLCNLVYTLNPVIAGDLTKFGVSLAGTTISVYTTDTSLILQSTVITV
jgi:hypothetical protein